MIGADHEIGRILVQHINQIECFYDKMEGEPFDLNKEKIVNYLNNHISESITSYQLIKKTDSYLSGDLDSADLMDLHRQLFLIAEDNDFYLDMSKHEGLTEGLPYNLDFVIRNDRFIHLGN